MLWFLVTEGIQIIEICQIIREDDDCFVINSFMSVKSGKQ